LSFASKVFLN